MLRRLLSRTISPGVSSLATALSLSSQAQTVAKPGPQTLHLSSFKAYSLISPTFFTTGSYLPSTLAVRNTASYGNRFFSSNLPHASLSTPESHKFPISPYIMGPILTPAFVLKNKAVIESSKKELKTFLGCNDPQQKDLSRFVDLLFDLEKTAKLIKNIDAQVQKLLSANYPRLFEVYQKIVLENNLEKLNNFFKRDFLPALRFIFTELAKHYGFDPALVETNDGLLLDDDYIDFVSAGKLILDLGEDAHGPFPHILAAFMMKELELEGQLSSARSLYQSLAERSSHYCPDRANYNYRFRLLLDFPNAYPVKSTQFCNPSSLANHLLLNGETLKQFAAVCKKHSHALAKLSREEWEQLENKSYLTRGKVIRF